jgi:hypothetical protein
MAAKHEVDALITTVLPDQVSLVTYTNQAIAKDVKGEVTRRDGSR